MYLSFPTCGIAKPASSMCNAGLQYASRLSDEDEFLCFVVEHSPPSYLDGVMAVFVNFRINDRIFTALPQVCRVANSPGAVAECKQIFHVLEFPTKGNFTIQHSLLCKSGST